VREMYLIGGGNARVGDGLLVKARCPSGTDLFRWNLSVPRMCCFMRKPEFISSQ